jgi:DNA-binding response OmpR family regulator
MKKVILIIDDEELLTQTFTRLLEKSGYDVYSAKKGEDAICMAEGEDFDLVISDIRMPGQNGVEIVRSIRTMKPQMPVIFITGFADDVLEKAARELKPIAYLHKPFDVLQLLSTIKSNLT